MKKNRIALADQQLPVCIASFLSAPSAATLLDLRKVMGSDTPISMCPVAESATGCGA